MARIMTTMKIFNQFYAPVYSIITIAILAARDAKWIPRSADPALLIAIVVVAVLAPIVPLEFLVRQVLRRRARTEAALEELREDLSRTRKKAIVVIRNAPFCDIGLRKRFTVAVRERDWWDWSYIGFHPDCEQLCDALLTELKAVYADSSDSDEIKTSSLTFMKQYPLATKRESLVFMGDVVVPPDSDDPKYFPDHIWHEISQKGYKVDFYKLYIIESAWKADETNEAKCTIRRADVERDPSTIKKQWNEVYQALIKEVSKSESLVFKDRLPQTEDAQKFFGKLGKEICEICKSSLFVISPSSGSALSVARTGFSEHKWAKRLLIVGWWLSPLSFYNDFIANLPLSLAISFPFIYFWGLNKTLVVGSAYTFTNILGFVLIYWGLSIAGKDPQRRLSKGRTLIIFTVYLTAISMIGKFLYEFDWGGLLASISQMF